MAEHPKWKRLSKKTLYKGRVHIVEHSVILPNGTPSHYEVDHSEKGAVAVLILTPENEIILSHQYRFALDAWIYDLPGGGVGEHENVRDAAVRECQEEVGIVPRALTELITFYPNPGRSDWSSTLFFCDDYEVTDAYQGDPSEVVEQVRIPINDLKKKIHLGEIVDPSLLIAWHTAIEKGLVVLS